MLFFVLTLFACGDSGLAHKDEMELKYNYMLLRAYFYRPERIKEYSYYEGMEIDSMYSDLKDYLKGRRYTYYIEPKKSDDFINNMENTPKYHSFGFERKRENDTLVVTAVYPISPAASAGLKKRDKLLLADNVPLTGANAALYEKYDSLFAEATVFTVLRNEKLETLPKMQKTEVQDPTVYLDSVGGIPYIRVTHFKTTTNNPEGTYAEFKNALLDIKGAEVAIVDLRGNPGGHMWHCTAMAAELVPLNSELVYDVEHRYSKLRGNVVDTVRHFARDYLESEGNGVGIKWVLLINGGSASCAERFAVAVKASRPETIIVGQTSYGKGIGQIYTKTYLDGIAYITCLESFYPNGKPFHEIGVKPDREADASDIYYAALEEAQKFDSGILARSLRASIQLKNLPPERNAKNVEPGMYYTTPCTINCTFSTP